MDKKELGKRIHRARQERGFTQEETEHRLKLPQKSMTRMESGQRPPSTLELAKLAELFHMPIGDFLKPESPDTDPLIALHRMAPGLENDPAIREEINRCIHLCREGISLEKLLEQPPRQYVVFSPSERPSALPEFLKQGELVASEERKRLEINNHPIPDIVSLLTSQGIWCAATRLPPEMSGLFLYHPSVGKIILVNASHGSARQRFSYAHEYAHALFDADHQILISNVANSSELLEKRANAFAAAFLLPQEGIAQTLYSLNKGHNSRNSFSVYDVSTDEVIESEDRLIAKNQKLTPQDIAFIAHRFGVSYQAVVYRLQSLRYLFRKDREELLNEESKGRDYLRLLNIDDPEKIEKNPPLQRELKTYITHLVIEAYRQEKISRGRVIELAKILKLSPQDLLDLVENE